MRKVLFFTVFSVLAFAASAQNMVTPGTGVNWNLDSLVSHFPGSVSKISATEFQMSDSLEVAAADSLVLDEALTWRIDSGMLVRVYGTFISDAGANQIEITGPDTAKPFYGFRFEEFSSVSFNNTFVKFGGGLRVLTEDFMMDNSEVSYNSSGASTGAAINFSRGNPVVKNSIFRSNELPAFGSGANQEVGAVIINNLLEGNSQSNGNRPQINLGPSGLNDTTYVIGNTIIGDRSLDKVGGISVSSLLSVDLNAVIDSNLVRNNRYGITMSGANINGQINGNIIDSNDTQGNPMLGGSGISLSSNSGGLYVTAAYNEINYNLWGITLIGQASINLGDTLAATYNEGKNKFSGNGNGGSIYALYNNTGATVSALNNCWESDTTLGLTAEDVIFHLNDDATLGEVQFNPVWDCQEGSNVGLESLAVNSIDIFPNPSNGEVNVDLPSPGTLHVYDLKGTVLYSAQLDAGLSTLQTDLPTGMYALRILVGEEQYTQKLIIK